MLRSPKLRRRTWLLVFTLLYLLLVNSCGLVRFPTGLLLGAVGAPDEVINTLVGDLQCSTLHSEYTGFFERGIVLSNTFQEVQHRFQEYKQCHPSSPDTVLYRTYRFEPYMFWEVGPYFTLSEWKLPYLNPQQVQPRLSPRPAPICPYGQGDEYWHNRNL